MLDINLFRVDKGGNPDIVRESQRRRDPTGKLGKVALVDKVIALDQTWRDSRYELDQLNKEFNALNKQIALKKRAGEDAADLLAQSAAVDAKVKEAAAAEAANEEACRKVLMQIGNLVHDSVPVNDDEDFNEVVRTFGEPRDEKGLPNHVDLVSMLGIVNLEKGQEVAGGRGYYLVGYGALLNQALIAYALSFLAKRGSCPVQTPFFMNKTCMGECAQLADYDEQLYKVSGEGEDKYLIATSEQTMCSMLRRTWIQERELPQRYAGYSTCFRKEAGSHGRDTLGIFRVHQFEKVEQFSVSSPERNDSWDEMERMIANAEEFYQSLGLPYRVVNIVSGELNDAAAKKYDLEAWFPASKTFRELVSCSNCTDYQSRNLEVRHGAPKKGPEGTKSYVHLLNSTLTATERTLCCILENHQTPDGFSVPEALRPFMHGVTFVPFRKVMDKKGRLVDVKPPPPPFFVPKHPGDEPPAVPTLYLPAGAEAAQPANAAVAHMAKLVPNDEFAVVQGPPPASAGAPPGAACYVDGDLTVGQPHAILRHLARVGKRLYPGAAADAARCEAVLEWLAAEGGAALAAGGEGRAAAVAKMEDWCASRGGKLAGKGPTIADVAASAHLAACGAELPAKLAAMAKEVAGLK